MKLFCKIALFVAVVSFPCIVEKAYVNNKQRTIDIKEEVKKEVKKYSCPNLLMSMIKVESNFNPLAISKKGAVGLMQIMPNIWVDELKDKGIIESENDLFTIDKNIRAGHYILTKYQEGRTLHQALKKYSGGDNRYHKRVIKCLEEINIE